jgi:hypothetical protein
MRQERRNLKRRSQLDELIERMTAGGVRVESPKKAGKSRAKVKRKLPPVKSTRKRH